MRALGTWQKLYRWDRSANVRYCIVLYHILPLVGSDLVPVTNGVICPTLE